MADKCWWTVCNVSGQPSCIQHEGWLKTLQTIHQSYSHHKLFTFASVNLPLMTETCLSVYQPWIWVIEFEYTCCMGYWFFRKIQASLLTSKAWEVKIWVWFWILLIQEFINFMNLGIFQGSNLLLLNDIGIPMLTKIKLHWHKQPWSCDFGTAVELMMHHDIILPVGGISGVGIYYLTWDLTHRLINFEGQQGFNCNIKCLPK